MADISGITGLDSIPTARLVNYSIIAGTAFEIGVGLYDPTAGSIKRLIINQNSNGTSDPISLPAGQKTIACGILDTVIPQQPNTGAPLNAPVRTIIASPSSNAANLLPSTAIGGSNSFIIVEGPLTFEELTLTHNLARRTLVTAELGNLFRARMFPLLYAVPTQNTVIQPTANLSRYFQTVFSPLSPESLDWIFAMTPEGNFSWYSPRFATIAQIRSANPSGTLILTGRQIVAQAQSAGLLNSLPLKVVPIQGGGTAPAFVPRVGRCAGIITTAFSAATAALTAYELATTIIDNVVANINNYYYRQGRLQVSFPQVANNDMDRQGAGSIIYYYPVYGDNPQSQAKVTLRTPGTTAGGLAVGLGDPLDGGLANSSLKIDYGFVMADGTVPTVDISQPSPCPFTLMQGRLPDQSKAKSNIPADIFIMYPSDLTVAQFDLVGTTPGVPRAPTNANQLPRLFYLNWWSSIHRNNGNLSNWIGHELVFNASTGPALKIRPSSDSRAIFQDIPNGLDQDWRCLYLGTIVPLIDGYVQCVPGCRLLWNYYNQIAYDDTQIDLTDFWPINQFAIGNNYMPMHRERPTVWNHHYVNPCVNEAFIPAPSLTAGISLGILGPIGFRVVQYQQDLTENGQPVPYAEQVWQQSATNTTPASAMGFYPGQNSQTIAPTIKTWPTMIKPTAFTPGAGLNIIEVQQWRSSLVSIVNQIYGYGFAGTIGVTANGYEYLRPGLNIQTALPIPGVQYYVSPLPNGGASFGVRGSC